MVGKSSAEDDDLEKLLKKYLEINELDGDVIYDRTL